MYQRNKLFACIALGLMSFNTILYPLLLMKNLSLDDCLMLISGVNFISLNIICFIIGSILALIPYKGLKYWKKCLGISLFIILIIQSVETVGLLLISLFKWGLGYPI